MREAENTLDTLRTIPRKEAEILGLGPLAHLVERFHGMEEVIGSIPIWSTLIHKIARAFALFSLSSGRNTVAFYNVCAE